MRRLIAVLTALVVLAAVAPSAAAAAPPSRLPAFSSCADLVGFARRNLARPSVPSRVAGSLGAGLNPRAPMGEAETGLGPGGRPIESSREVQPAPAESALDDFSRTNVQEAGIDEPDIVKTDGRRLFVVAGTELRAYDVTGDVPTLLGALSLEGAGGEILLRGDRVLLIGSAASTPTPSASVAVLPERAGPQTRLLEIDVRDPRGMRIARAMTVPGAAAGARLTGATARVVITGAAALSGPDTPTARRAAPQGRPGVSAFVPRTVLRSRLTGRTFRRQLVPCSSVRHPRAYAGNDLLTVLSIDLDRGLFNVDRDAVFAGAQVVYASPTGLYVASQRAVAGEPGEVPDGVRTEIHRFDTSTAGATTYASSGDVAGFVLNQYALSEHDGVLRVATTEEPQWASSNPEDQESQSAVTVLREAGARLEQVGRVGGLGRTERIYAARFIGDAAYLVTFREVDPLYTLDLRDPERPRVVGELKIPGYSAYLHPIGDGLLLGVGQSATSAGETTGSQVSVFDVADPARPRQLHRFAVGGSSAAEFDPHAFLWWEPAQLALLPFNVWTDRRRDRGMLGLRAGRSEGLTEVGRIVHGPAWDRVAVPRSVIVGDRVLTVSDLGVAAHRLTGLAPIGFLPFTG